MDKSKKINLLAGFKTTPEKVVSRKLLTEIEKAEKIEFNRHASIDRILKIKMAQDYKLPLKETLSLMTQSQQKKIAEINGYDSIEAFLNSVQN